MKALACLAALALAGAALTGCTPQFDHLDFQPQTTPPQPVLLGYGGIKIPVGIAVGVKAVPMSGTDKLDDNTEVVLTPRQSGIVGADRTTLDGPSFVIYGIAPGTTAIDVRIDGELKGTVAADVTAQTGP